MEACDFHQRSPPARGRNCKFPFISSRVALGTSVKWENCKFGFHPHYCFPSFPFTWKELLANCTQVPLWGFSPRRATHTSLVIYDKCKHGLGVCQDEPETDQVHHIDPADALETSVFPCLRFAIIDKHGLVEGPSDWDRGTWPSILRAECTTWASWSPSTIRSTDERDSLLHFRRKFWLFVCPETGISLSSGVLCARFLMCPIINNTITKTSFLLHSFTSHLKTHATSRVRG